MAAQGQVTADLVPSDKDLASAQQVCAARGRTVDSAAAARACYDSLDRALSAQKQASGSQTALARAGETSSSDQ